jgi:hypothetical protein
LVLFGLSLKEERMFENMRLRTKLIAGFAFVASISAVIGGTSLMNIRTMSEADLRLYNDSTAPLPDLSAIAVAFQGMRIASRDFINAQSDSAQRAIFEEQIRQRGDVVTTKSESYQKRYLSHDMSQLFSEFYETHKNYQAYLSQIVALAHVGKDKEAWAILWSDGYNSTTNSELSLIDRMEQLKVEEAKQAAIKIAPLHEPQLSRS